MNTPDRRDAVLEAVLKHVPFDGWSDAAFKAGLADAGVGADEAARMFPGGIADVSAYFGRWVAARLESRLEDLAERETSIRRRIAAGVRALLELLAEHREAVQRLSPVDSRRGTVQGMGSLYRVVDIIWRAAGDRSTDFSFYTKRGLLAGVVVSTFFYWLDDRSDDFADTWTFLDRRIEDVLRLQKLRGRLERAAGSFGAPLDALRKSPLGGKWRAPSPR